MLIMHSATEMSRRKYQRMRKADRKNQKLLAEGVRQSILSPHIEPYADALARSLVAERDYLQRVYNEYHQLIPWRLSDDEEPDLPLPAYDPKAMAEEEELSADDASLKARTIANKNKVMLMAINVELTCG